MIPKPVVIVLTTEIAVSVYLCEIIISGWPFQLVKLCLCLDALWSYYKMLGKTVVEDGPCTEQPPPPDIYK